VRVAKLMRREAPPDAGDLCRVSLLLSRRGLRPSATAGRSGEHTEQRTDGQLDADVQPLLQLLPGPVVHADFAPAAALAAADEDCAAAWVEVRLGERECFVDAQAGAPEHDDQSAHPQAVRRPTGLSHDGADLLDLRRIGGIPAALVARRPAGVEPRHRRR
jgi:hypothetical protein